jgi:predicted double-glycine peptidase
MQHQKIRDKNTDNGYVLFILFFVLLNIPPLVTAKENPVISLLEARQSKVVMQQWDLSCGAAALTTLLKYQHSVNTDEKTVAKGLINRKEYINDPELLQRREGFSLLDLKRYTKKIGLQGKAYGKLTLDNLLNFAPVIVPINLSGYNHFVIFRGKTKNRVLLADPAWGNRTLFVSDFNKAWINFPKFGRVGFAVTNPEARLDDLFNNQLINTAESFSLLH